MTLSESTLLDLAARVERGAGSDRELDGEIYDAFCLDQSVSAAQIVRGGVDPNWLPRYTSSLDFVTDLLERVLPGFWWRGGTCFLSSEAIIAPDHNCPTHGARLMAEFPPTEAVWNEGIEVEIRPGSQGALVRALLAAVLKALADANTNNPSGDTP